MDSQKLQMKIEQKHRENEDLRKQLQQSQYDFQEYKKRMGKVVDLTLGSSGDLSEDLMNPCRESKLKNMYETLRKNHWAKLVPPLKKGGPGVTGEDLRKKAEEIIKDVLHRSQNDIQDIKDKMKHLTPSCQGHSSNTKATQHFDSTVYNLQLAIYHEKMGLYKTDQDVPEILVPLVEECYKIGCLMALHNPPLLLDFDNCERRPFPHIKTECSCATAVSIAVDLGSAFSGFCFRFAGSEQILQPTWGEELGFNTPKTPSCILFDQRQDFLGFGYDVMTYTRGMPREEAMKLYLFENFKMALCGKELNRDMMIDAKNGEKMPAMKVFSESLRFLKDQALEMIGKHTSGVKQCTWILTVPAIWSAAAKQFMREAAMEAGLVTESNPDSLVIVLEPEAASAWCKRLDCKGAEKVADPGTQYMVVDCGGGRVDIAVHKVVEGGYLKEVYWASETYMSDQTVDKKFKSFLKDLFSGVFDEFTEEHPSKLQRLMYDYSGDTQSFCMTWFGYLQEMFGNKNDTQHEDRVNKPRAKVYQEREYLYDILRSIETLIKDTLTHHGLNISFIFLVGGFAQSPYVNSFIKERFGEQCKVLCPADAQMAVLKGALEFGTVPNVLQSWINRFFQRIAIAHVFDETKPRSKCKYEFEHVKYSEILVYMLAMKDQVVHFSEFKDCDFPYLDKHQRQSQFHFYYNDTDEREFRHGIKIGAFNFPVPNSRSSSPSTLKLQVKFGCTEMQMTVTDVQSGETTPVKLDFLI